MLVLVSRDRQTSIGVAKLKLTGWCQRSYSTRITVDGKEVFTGRTPKGLGLGHPPAETGEEG